MSFLLLKRIIADFRKKASCSACKSRFDEDLIFVLATATSLPRKDCHVILLAICPLCALHSCVTAGFTVRDNQERSEELYIESAAKHCTISVDDVLDMHNLLKDWKGTIRDLFV